MDVKEDISSGNRMRSDGAGAPQSYSMGPRVENPSARNQLGAPTIADFAQPVHLPGANMNMPTDIKKRKGRPRKYDSDGVRAPTLSPMPISASIPLTGDFSGWKQPKARPYPVIKKAHKMEFEKTGERLPSLGANFTPHVMTVSAGEDITMKILSFSRQSPRAICVLSASGSISNVTLRQPNCPGGTLTHQGSFEILSLSGSFAPTDNGIVKSRTGGMSILLAAPDGGVLGGGLAGILTAGSPVQVVIGSFLHGHHQEQNPKKPRRESVEPVIPAVVNPVQGGGYGPQRFNFASPTFAQDPRDPNGDNNAFVSEEDTDDDEDGSPLNLEISG
ncbi:AT-hook motif nuclear-localized protein 6-like [Silene latifolia]|uniref:AT-hook motif nuclear-localized protein 6-like n=1 Tax=Silene latifolia TaxID=37657 RepID=UPI003D7707C8